MKKIENNSEELFAAEDNVYTIPEEEELFVKEEPQTFLVETEDGIVHTAELLAVVEIDKKDYAVYSIPGTEPGKTDILASYVVQDEEGFDTLRDITDPVDKAKITEFIKSMVD